MAARFSIRDLSSLALHPNMLRIKDNKRVEKERKTNAKFQKINFPIERSFEFLNIVGLSPNVIIFIERFLVIQRTSRTRCAKKLNCRFNVD